MIKTGRQLLALFRNDPKATIRVMSSSDYRASEDFVMLRDGKDRSKGMIKPKAFARLLREVATATPEPEPPPDESDLSSQVKDLTERVQRLEMKHRKKKGKQ